ncbi:Oxysterol-binding protein-domain-containing protein [Cladochytrium replicatum]|nr:Oxysterol-binding protein-domain-containing protein [Cladochytrium replicatum]
MSDNGSESVGTSIREGDEFYDAEDFVASEDEDVDVEEEGLVYSESAADLRRDGSQDDITSPERENQSSAGDGVSAKETIVDDAEIPTLVTSAAATANLPSSTAIVRRKVLPAGAASMASINILSILRNNVGKDLSTIPMPIVLNEPVNLLQKLAEELEYCSLIERASNTSNPVQRMAVVAAFAVSAYASMVYRTSKKPFNPLLGETYECWREDLGFKFISEKVSHRPPIMACHAEGPNFSFYQDSHVKTKFWGKSMEFIPSGTVHLVLPKFDEHYTWNKVTMCMRNLLAGTRYLEHYGTVKIESSNGDEFNFCSTIVANLLESGYYCVLNFKEAGYFTSSKNEVTGSIFNKADKKQLSISGRWDDGIFQFKDETPNNLEVIWRANKLTLEQQEGYGFSSLAVELNELTPDLKGKLPPTDTRYRPDQRMYEQGIVNEAELEKQRLEQMQREKLKALEQEGIKWTPRWFKHVDGKGWLYSGGYWEHRGRFGDIADIFAAEEK